MLKGRVTTLNTEDICRSDRSHCGGQNRALRKKSPLRKLDLSPEVFNLKVLFICGILWGGYDKLTLHTFKRIILIGVRMVQKKKTVDFNYEYLCGVLNKDIFFKNPKNYALSSEERSEAIDSIRTFFCAVLLIGNRFTHSPRSVNFRPPLVLAPLIKT